MARNIIIGDVHGCRVELEELWGLVAPTRQDHVVFVGDLLDRGPDSVGVVRFIRRKQANGYRISVCMGNHEIKNIAYHKKVRQAREQDVDWLPTAAGEVVDLETWLTVGEKDWLRTLPHYIILPEYDAIVVHAGIPEDVTYLPPAKDIKTYSNKKRAKYDMLMYIRFQEPSGRPVGAVTAQHGATFWADMYDGRLGHVYFGHQPIFRAEPVRFEHATALDLACCFGGWLCAMVLEGDDRSFVTVRAKEVYNNTYRDDEL